MVLYHEAIDYLREMQRRCDRELSSSDLVNLDMPELRELTLRMKSISTSENQIAKQVNATGSIYETDIKKNQEEIYEGIRKILISLSKIK